MKNTILVTGGAGFIGSHLCAKLLRLETSVILLDKFQKSLYKKIKQENISDIKSDPNFTIVDADISDTRKVAKVFKEQNISYVIHLANSASVSESIKDPIKTVRTNIIGTISLFENAVKYKIKHITFASTALVYGSKAILPMSEDDPCVSLTSPYAVSLRTIELMAQAYNYLYGIPITGLRLFPVIGPKMRQDLFLPVVVRAISERKPIRICGDGTTVRTYTDIDDIVTGIISSIACLNGYQIINLGGTDPISLLDIINLVEGILETKAKIIFMPQRQEEIFHLYPSIEKAKKILGFIPKVTIKDSIKKYIVWYKNGGKDKI